MGVGNLPQHILVVAFVLLPVIAFPMYAFTICVLGFCNVLSGSSVEAARVPMRYPRGNGSR